MMERREIEGLIAPGEFEFCHHCGSVMIVPGTSLCCCCRGTATRDELFVRDIIHQTLEKQREHIATLRKSQGTKQLFWMNQR